MCIQKIGSFDFTSVFSATWQCYLLCSLAFSLLSGCTASGNPTSTFVTQLDPYSQVAPEAVPRKTITSFTAALQCMDGLLGSSQSEEILVGMTPVNEMGGSVVGIADMLMTSLSTMSSNSKLVKVIATSPTNSDYYEHASNQNFIAPEVFIRIS